MVHKFFDLRFHDRSDIFFCLPCLSPLDGLGHGIGDMPARLPAEGGLELGAVEFEEARFVRPLYADVLPTLPLAPTLAEEVSELACRHAVAIVGADIVPAGIAWFFVLRLCDHQVGIERLQHMLVGPRRVRVAHLDRLLGIGCTDAVWDDAVGRKIAATDDIAGTRRRYGTAALGEEALGKAVRHELGAALTVGVRVVAVKRLILAIAPDPFLVLVDLIGCHVEEGADALCLADAFEDVDRAHDIRRIRADRVTVALDDDGLCRKMQNNLRLSLHKDLAQRLEISHIADDRFHIGLNASLMEDLATLFRRRRQGIACDLCAE